MKGWAVEAMKRLRAGGGLVQLAGFMGSFNGNLISNYRGYAVWMCFHPADNVSIIGRMMCTDNFKLWVVVQKFISCGLC